MLPEYDFSKARPNKYAKGFAEGTNLVLLSPDVAKYFPDSETVNEALRTLVRIARKHVKKTRAESDDLHP
jgi:hypothetical protein